MWCRLCVVCNTFPAPSLAFLFSYKSDAKRAAVFALNNHHYVMKTLCAQVCGCECNNVTFFLVCVMTMTRVQDDPVVSHALCDSSRLEFGVCGLWFEVWVWGFEGFEAHLELQAAG